MAKLTHAESRRLYSWWWDSHISPKNSKWLQENLTEMDFKVKAMIKLIEEDADSFAKRAEMYYKKRPELMKLVEEFYRAYRALSERYDHATGALRQARRTIEEAFPSRIPFMPSDEPDSGPSSIGSASHASPGPVFDADDSQKNHDVKKDGTESEKEATLLQHNQSLERISNMEAEISHYQQELKKLNDEMLISVSNLINTEERCLLLDEANQSLQLELDALKHRANEQSVELKKKQEDLEKLKDMELSKMGVEEEIRQLKEENGNLNEQILGSALKIISLQDEIILLKDMKAKLEDEVRFHEEEKVVLQQEISYLKEDKIELEKRDYQLMEQIEELKVTCKKHEDEKVFHLENLKLMENISEKNVVLENSLSGANVEIEGSREKINMLRDSCGSLNATISVHLSEKASLVSQVEKLSDRSKFLENSLSDMNAELESLQVKSKNMEESCRSLFAQNYTLLSEKDTLVSQVERAIRSLETLETRYFELEHKHLNLENEKESALDEIMELEDSFKQEKGEYETLIMSIMLSSNSQVSSLENQIGFLHEEAQLGEEEFEAEQHNLMDAQIENFIFQNCLRDTNEKYHRQLEAAKCSDKLISEHKQELLVQGKKLASSSELNERLREGIQSILRELRVINKGFNSVNGMEDESILELTLREIKDLSNSISDTQNENQHLLLENSIILTILTQFGLQAMDPRMEKDALERGFENKIQEFSVSQSAHSTLQSDVSKLLEENRSLSKNFYDLKEKSDMLEEENRILLAELVTAEFLYLIFKNSSEEKASELQVSKNDLVHLHGVKNALDLEVGPAIEKLVSTMIENIHLKEMSANLQGSFKILENDLNMTRNICEQSKLEIESTKSLSSQKNIQLLQADQRLRTIKEESMEVRTRLEGLQLDLDKVMKVREELDNKIISFDDGNAMRDHQITGLRQENEMIIKERDQFRQEIDRLKTREEHLIYDLQKGIDEVNSCEMEVERLLNDFHTTTVNSLIFEEKALELLMACEMSTMIQREKLHEEMNLANADMNELKEKLASIEDENGILKEELNAYLLPITALSDDIASLEEHTFSLANHHKPNYQEKREEQMFYHEHGNSTQKPSDDHNEIISTRGLVELRKLRDKVKALETVVVNTGNLIEQGTFESNSNAEAVMKEIEALKSEANWRDSKDIDTAKYEQMMKDIQLDRYGNESNDDTSVTSHELISIMSESSERTDIDKLQFPKRFSESHKDLNKSAIQRLLSDAQRLSLLQVSVEELKRDMEASKMNRSPKGSEFDTVTAKLRESEGEVSQLIETNSELIKKSEELLSALPDEMRIVSERTGRLEYDLEKIKYVLLKLKEEHENKRGKVSGRRRVLLKDYLYGRMDSRKQKKGRSWRCMRPKTMND